MNREDGQVGYTKWLVHKSGVIPVRATAAESGEALVTAAVGASWVARASDVFATEAEARREHVDREACALEEQADRHDVMRVDAEELARSHADDAEWNRVKAAEARARAKGLREALVEVGP
jgi:hypothetical protein